MRRFTVSFDVTPEQCLDVLKQFAELLRIECGTQISSWDYLPHNLKIWIDRSHRREVLLLVKLKFLTGVLPEFELTPYSFRRGDGNAICHVRREAYIYPVSATA